MFLGFRVGTGTRKIVPIGTHVVLVLGLVLDLQKARLKQSIILQPRDKPLVLERRQAWAVAASSPGGRPEALADGRNWCWCMVWTGEQGSCCWGHLWTSLLTAPRLRQAFDRCRSLKAAALRVESPSLWLITGNSLSGAVQDDVR